MGIIIWLIVGGIIGWLASLIMKTDAQQGILLNVIVGIIGAFLGGLIFSFVGLGGAVTGPWNLGSFVVAVIGAIVLLFILRMVRRA